MGKITVFFNFKSPSFLNSNGDFLGEKKKRRFSRFEENSLDG
jgi:hypothetical protein